MIPYVTRATEEVLKLVPRSLREAGYALGLPKWRITLFIVLPSAVNGIVTGTLLAVARIAGEAAPLLFTAFGNNFLNTDPNQPIQGVALTNLPLRPLSRPWFGQNGLGHLPVSRFSRTDHYPDHPLRV